jgi:hypothetical protein
MSLSKKPGYIKPTLSYSRYVGGRFVHGGVGLQFDSSRHMLSYQKPGGQPPTTTKKRFDKPLSRLYWSSKDTWTSRASS